jgi:hypothetical protein
VSFLYLLATLGIVFLNVKKEDIFPATKSSFFLGFLKSYRGWTMSLGEWIPTFQSIVVSSSSRVKQCPLDCLTPEDEGTTIL